MRIRTAIVDDEELARRVLEEHIAKITNLDVVLSSGNPVEFINYTRQHQVDLVFLDIEMPELSGMEILRSLTTKPSIILTTAYADYAFESYEFGVVDYLLKPIKFERFLKALNKLDRDDLVPEKKSIKQGFQLKHDGLFIDVLFESVRYIKSFGNYLRIFTDARMYLVADTLTNFITQLPVNFQRTHKSYVVNLHRVSKVTSTHVVIHDSHVPVSPMYKIIVHQKLKAK